MLMRLLFAIGFSVAVSSFARAEDDSHDSAAEDDSHDAAASDAPFQELVYSLRSLRLSRQAPTAACAAAGFTPVVEDFLVFYSTRSRSRDGRIVNFSVRQVGSIIACFGLTSRPDLLNFYAPSIDIDGISASGTGECNYMYFNTPAQGSSYLRCFLRLDVPGFSGGFLATNTASGTEIVQSDVSHFGTHESSFAIVRLWRPNQ